MLPEISLEILKTLQTESLESKKIILEWSFVLETVKQKVKKTQILDGYDLYLMLCLLQDYSLVSSNILQCTSKILYLERMFCLLSFLYLFLSCEYNFPFCFNPYHAKGELEGVSQPSHVFHE